MFLLGPHWSQISSQKGYCPAPSKRRTKTPSWGKILQIIWITYTKGKLPIPFSIVIQGKVENWGSRTPATPKKGNQLEVKVTSDHKGNRLKNRAVLSEPLVWCSRANTVNSLWNSAHDLRKRNRALRQPIKSTYFRLDVLFYFITCERITKTTNKCECLLHLWSKCCQTGMLIYICMRKTPSFNQAYYCLTALSWPSRSVRTKTNRICPPDQRKLSG